MNTEISTTTPLGLNNKLPYYKMGIADAGTWLRTANNIDLSDGVISRRKGYALQQAGQWRDLWADDDAAYAVVNGCLCAVDLQTTEATPIDGAFPQGPVSYCRLPDGFVYASDGRTLWQLDGASYNPLPPADSTQCDTMPAGACLAHYRGQLLVASNGFLFISEPYQYNAYKKHKGFIPFPAPITVVAPCEDGVYVCADKTYWIGGDLFEGGIVVVLPFGGLAGSAAFDKEQTMAYWQSPHGLVFAKPSGAVTLPQDAALHFEKATKGKTWVRETDGRKHILTVRETD